MKHTAGRLSLDRYGNIKTEDADDFRINGATLSSKDVAMENTKRLVTCWNEHDDLVKERDELVALLYDLLSVADADPELSQYPAAKAARELLAEKYPEAS
jgi:hypothetical protein